MKLVRFILGGVLVATAVSSFAVSLGRNRGVALIGQPLEMTVPLRADAGEDLGALCFEADVFYADTLIDPNRVRVSFEPSANPQEGTVRIRAQPAIDEPVVTVYLKTGCAQKVTRRYVLLADVAPGAASSPTVPLVITPTPAGNAAAAAPPAGPPVGPPRTRSGDASATGGPGSPAGTEGSPFRPGRSARAARPNPGTVVPAAPAAERPRSVVKKPSPAEATKARLKLDPVELTAERDPTLRATAELLTQPLENDPKRAEAAALWRAINAQPQDVLRDTQRLQGMETELKSLRDQTAKTQAGVAELRTKLERAESQRYANTLVYTLAGLLLAALAAAGYFWWRMRSQGRSDWWRGDDPETGFQKIDTTVATPLGDLAPPKTPKVDVDLTGDESIFDSLRTQAYQRSAPAPLARAAAVAQPEFVSSFGGTPRSVDTEELFDVQQQADFFVSLGQYEQAIDVLVTHINDKVDTSALAYLDLSRIFHTLGRREDYAELRGEFNRVFNADMPDFDRFSDESKGLASYTQAMSRIESLWPSPRVLEVIQESIFRKPGSDGAEPFDLEAYRELLLLHAIAKEVVDPNADPMEFEFSDSDSQPGNAQASLQPSRFSETRMDPLPTGKRAGATAVDASKPLASPRLGLDIDLTGDADEAFGVGGPPTIPGEQMIDLDFTPSSYPVSGPKPGKP